MNGRFLLTAFILLLFTSAGAQHKDVIALEAKIKDVVSRCAPATVLISSSDPSGGIANASGVMVSEDGIVLTAGHVSFLTVYTRSTLPTENRSWPKVWEGSDG